GGHGRPAAGAAPGRVDGRPGVRHQDARDVQALVCPLAEVPHCHLRDPVRAAGAARLVGDSLWAEVVHMTGPRWVKPVAITAGAPLAAAALVVLLWKTSLGQAVTWQRQISPGRLSAAHAFLEDNCAACHTAGRGPEAANCVVCHANDAVLLQRQPT